MPDDKAERGMQCMAIGTYYMNRNHQC